jgi:hypothetical protein
MIFNIGELNKVKMFMANKQAITFADGKKILLIHYAL